MRILGLTPLLFLLLPMPARPQDFSFETPEPYEILADRMEIQKTAGGTQTLLEGNVRIRHGTIVITADHGEASDQEEWAVLRGGVRIVSDTTVFTADQATYEKRLKKATLLGNVRVVDGARTVTCNRMVYLRDVETIEALGDVRVEDKREKYILTAGHGFYDRRAKHSIATEDPRLILETTKKSADPVTVSGKVMEIWDGDRRAVAREDVRIQRRELLVECQEGTFLRGEDRAILTGNPQVIDNDNNLRAKEIELLLHENSIERAFLKGDAVALQTAADSSGLADSTGSGPREESQVSGDLITVYLENEKIQKAVVTGNARSVYYPRGGGTNLASGKGITLLFQGDKVSSVEMDQEAEGIYYPPPKEKKVE